MSFVIMIMLISKHIFYVELAKLQKEFNHDYTLLLNHNNNVCKKKNFLSNSIYEKSFPLDILLILYVSQHKPLVNENS